MLITHKKILEPKGGLLRKLNQQRNTRTHFPKLSQRKHNVIVRKSLRVKQYDESLSHGWYVTKWIHKHFRRCSILSMLQPGQGWTENMWEHRWIKVMIWVRDHCYWLLRWLNLLWLLSKQNIWSDSVNHWIYNSLFEDSKHVPSP